LQHVDNKAELIKKQAEFSTSDVLLHGAAACTVSCYDGRHDILYSFIENRAIPCNTVQCCAILCNTVHLAALAQAPVHVQLCMLAQIAATLCMQMSFVNFSWLVEIA
jgi:hypothetical protein